MPESSELIEKAAMRVADQQIFGLVLNQFQSISQKTLEAQLQASSGKRVSKPSDDPIAFGRIVLDKSDLAQSSQWLQEYRYRFDPIWRPRTAPWDRSIPF